MVATPSAPSRTPPRKLFKSTHLTSSTKNHWGISGVAIGATLTALTALLSLVVTWLNAGPWLTAIVISLAVVVLLALGNTRAPVGRSDAPGEYPSSLIATPAGFYLAFFGFPLLLLVLYAFATQTGFGTITFGTSLSNFAQALAPIYRAAFWRSVQFAVIGTVLTVLVGFPFAYYLARHAAPSRRPLLVGLIMVPFWTSFLIRAYAILVLLSDDFVLAKALRMLGIVVGPLNLQYSGTAVQIGLVYGYLPLFILPVFASLERLDWRLLDAAADLGASKWRAFLQITVPLAAPGLLTGALLVFVPMTGEYVIPSVLGGGQVDLAANIVSRAFIGQQNYPFGAALGVLIMLALLSVLVLYTVSSRRAERRISA